MRFDNNLFKAIFAIIFSLYYKMFYLTEVEDYIRVEPRLFGLPTMEAIEQQLQETYKDYYDREIGRVISVIEIINVGKES